MEIPFFPDSRPLDIADKPLLDSHFERLQPSVSELTFAGLYLFRVAHAYHLSMIGNSLVIIGSGYDGQRYCLPPFGGDIAVALSVVFAAGLSLYGADQAFVTAYLSDRGLEVTEDRDSFDYLYLREDLATLPTNRFHKKKNRIKYFSVRHAYEVSLLSRQHCDGCLVLLNEWGSAGNAEDNRSFKLELDATAEALENMELLGLEGLVVTVEGIVKAFAVGERLNKETAVCHFEKADPFMEGLSQLVNREFCRLLFNDCSYVNREQDLGEPGLRNAKLSYHPVELVKKFRARVSKNQ